MDAPKKQEDGQFLWGATFADTDRGSSYNRGQELEELEILKEVVAESLEAFGSLRVKYDMVGRFMPLD